MMQFPGERNRFLDCAVQSNISLQMLSTNRVARLILADANFEHEHSSSSSENEVARFSEETRDTKMPSETY